MYTLPKIERFNQEVLSKYFIYNSVFITLPFDSIDNTGVLLPLFTDVCDIGFKKQETPKEIVDFFTKKDANFQKLASLILYIFLLIANF